MPRGEYTRAEELSELQKPNTGPAASERAAANVEKVKEWIASYLGLKIELVDRRDDPRWKEYVVLSPTGKPVWSFRLDRDAEGTICLELSQRYQYQYATGGCFEWMEELQREIKRLNHETRPKRAMANQSV